MTTTTMITDGGLRLALHELRAGGGASLLLLHGLGEESPQRLPPALSTWSGAVYALDFAGHGSSELAAGGGYTAEGMTPEADAALARLGEATLVGRGLGAYVALLLAGTRPERVNGLILAAGAGLAGNRTRPRPPFLAPVPVRTSTPDDLGLAELGRDPRPSDYAVSFATAVLQRSAARPPLVVSAAPTGWLAAVADLPGVQAHPLAEAVAIYSRQFCI